MAFARASAVRGAYQAFRPLRTSVGKPQSWRQVGRRSYASHGGDTKQASSDIPWAIGAVAVTVPSVWYLLQPASGDVHGHGDHHGGHGNNYGDEHNKEAGDGEESEDNEKESESSDDSGSDGEGVDGSDTPKDEKNDKKEETTSTKNQPNDEHTTSKPAGGQKDQAEKQEKLSNADNKHSTDIEGDPGKSKKGEGIPETAKTKGSVDPKRPQA